MTKTVIVFLVVPFSLVGAVWLLYLLDYHLSVAVWVGLIALAGPDAETGVMTDSIWTWLTSGVSSSAHRRTQDDST